MIAICEECGAKYRIDSSRFQEDTIRVRCNACESVIEISKSKSLTSGYQAPEQPPPGRSAPEPQTAGSKGRERRMALLLLPAAVLLGAGLLYLIG